MGHRCLQKLLPENVLRFISVLFGCFCVATAGSMYAFNAYANSLKASFNLTQTEVGLLASLVNFGMGVGLPAGLLCEKFGSPATLLVGSIITCSSLTALWSSFKSPTFYNNNFILLCAYFLLAGFGGIFSYIAGFTINIKNFPAKHRGKIVSILDCAFSGGPMIFVALYGAVYVNGHISDEQNQNLRGYILMNVIVFVAVNSFGSLFIWEYPPEPRLQLDFSQDFSDVNSDPGAIDQYQVRPSDEPEIHGFSLFKDKIFHLLLWPFVLCAALQVTIQNNIGVYLKSFGYESHTTTLTTLYFAVCVISKLLSGSLSDVIMNTLPRISFLLISNAVQTILLFGSLFWAENLIYFYIMICVISVSNGFLWCLTPTIISETFGTTYFARNWGIMMTGTSIIGCVCQVSFGVLYSTSIHSPATGNSNDDDCEGLHCFTWSFVIAFVLSIISTALNVVHWEIDFSDIRRRKGYATIPN